MGLGEGKVAYSEMCTSVAGFESLWPRGISKQPGGDTEGKWMGDDSR